MFDLEIRTGSKYRPNVCNDLNKIITPFVITNDARLVINPNVIGEINTTFNKDSKGAFDGLIEHLTKEFIATGEDDGYIVPLFEIEINKNLPLIDVIAIKINGKTCGYYLPETKEFLVTDWVWHPIYTNTIIAWIWPQIVQGLLKIDPGVFEGCDLNPVEDKPIVTLDTLKKVKVKPKVKEVITT